MQFKNIQVTVSGRNIMASDASISEQNGVVPIYTLGYKGNIAHSPNGPLNNQISINYIVEPENDPNYLLLQQIKNYDFSAFPIPIVVGGITGAGYLNSYSLNVRSNDAVTASATYSIFTHLTGQLNDKPAGINYNLSRGSGVAHSWTTYPRMYNGNLTGSILELAYSFNAEWATKYKPGQHKPIEVKFLNGNEQFDILNEYNARITYSGQSFNEKFYDIETIEINPLSGLWTSVGNNSKILLYPLSGKIISNRINIGPDNIITSETTIIKNY